MFITINSFEMIIARINNIFNVIGQNQKIIEFNKEVGDMKLLEGCELVELTDDRIVQEYHFGESGVIRMIGNPNPPQKEHQECINKVAKILLKGYQRSLKAEQEKSGA